MQLKFTLQSARPQSSGPQSSGAVSRDLVVTIDSSATVGDLATYLVRADPQRSALAALDDGELTLALVD